MTVARGITWDELCEVGLRFPGVEIGISYRTPALKLLGKGLVRLKEDGETLVLPIDLTEREILLQTEPDIFYLTPHYADHSFILVHLSKVDPSHLQRLLEAAWRRAANKQLIAEYDRRK